MADIPSIILSILFIILGTIRAILGYIFLFFIPGFAITFALYPRITDISPLTRIALSLVVSVGAVMAAVLFLDLVLGVDITPVTSFLIILIISVLAGAVWVMEILYLTRRNCKE